MTTALTTPVYTALVSAGLVLGDPSQKAAAAAVAVTVLVVLWVRHRPQRGRPVLRAAGYRLRGGGSCSSS